CTCTTPSIVLRRRCRLQRLCAAAVFLVREIFVHIFAAALEIHLLAAAGLFSLLQTNNVMILGVAPRERLFRRRPPACRRSFLWACIRPFPFRDGFALESECSTAGNSR